MQYNTNPTHPNINSNNTNQIINSKTSNKIPKNHNKNYNMISTKTTNTNIMQQLFNKFYKISDNI